MRIAIAGGGIAGVSAALALSGRGHQIEVFERAPEPREVGAGIQLSPNAMRILERWDVPARLEGRLVEPEAIEIHDGSTGRLLAAIPLGASARLRYGAPYCLVHRAELLAALIETAAARDDISLVFDSPVGHAVNEVTQARFEVGGAPRVADLLVAADGIRSTIRNTCLDLPGAVPLGRVAWRGNIAASSLPAGISAVSTGLWLGAGAHVVHYPVSGAATINVVLIAANPSEAGEIPVSGFAGPVEKLVRAVGSDWTLWPLERIDESAPWARGRIVLIGDAAHAMAPSAAQGGAQAIEDAYALAASLERLPDPQAAIAAFLAERRPRVARVAREGLLNLRIYELRGVVAQARNLAIRALSPDRHLRRLDWLYAGGPIKYP